MRKAKVKEPPFKMVKVYEKDATPEQLKEWEQEEQEQEMNRLMKMAGLAPQGSEFECGLGRLAEFHSMFPGEQALAEDGDWIIVKKSPPTEYTVPPLSIWFATRWPMDEGRRRVIHRVKVTTPRGDVGLFPHEYSKITEIEKYYEFIGDGMTIHFFGNEEGIPKDKLFYLRSRGVSKRDAITMLLKTIRNPGVCWIETDRAVASAFVHDWQWPDESRLATKREALGV